MNNEIEGEFDSNTCSLLIYNAWAPSLKSKDFNGHQKSLGGLLPIPPDAYADL